MTADRLLLLGLLALQNGLIRPAHLVAAFHAWTGAKSRSLADHLIALGHLGAAHRSVLEALADLHVAARGGDVERSLAAVPVGRSTLESLSAVRDPDVVATMAHVGSGHGPVDVVPPAGDPGLAALRSQSDFRLLLMDLVFPADPFGRP